MPSIKKKQHAETVAVKVRPETRSKFEKVRQIKRWSYVDIAEFAVDALIQTDKQLEPLRPSLAH